MFDDIRETNGADRANRIEVYKIYKGYLEHENLLLNQRVTWLVTIQSFMLAAYAIPMAKPEIIRDKLSEAFGDFISLYLVSVCVLAMAVCVDSLLSIGAAITAAGDVENRWTREHKSEAEAIGLPHIAGGGHRNVGKRGGTFARYIPWLMIAFWLANFILITSKFYGGGEMVDNAHLMWARLLAPHS